MCTDGYVPPELMSVRGCRPKTVDYSSPVDVWSAGVVAFEVATIKSCLKANTMTLDGIARRIGQAPPEYGSIGGAAA